jgi:hypothetical protein
MLWNGGCARLFCVEDAIGFDWALFARTFLGFSILF